MPSTSFSNVRAKKRTLKMVFEQKHSIGPSKLITSLEPEASQKEVFSSWALFILIMLLIFALFASYMLQHKKIQAIHETVLSIFAGMAAGLVINLTEGTFIQNTVSFNYQFFFNLLLPPIILASGYELHQANFFRHIGTILTFAFAGTFISAVVLGVFLWLWTRLPLDGFQISFVEAISVGATLSATDPVTILAIFNTYKVDPKLYTIIFGESILNDAIAIVIFDTAQRYGPDKTKGASLTIGSFFEAVGIFFLVFFGSMLIGVLIGIGTALLLKFTLVRRFPKIESCLVILIAYASYYFANGALMSGIVSLLFCGITLKHYAYYNMSRRTQLTTKYMFSALAQLSENFIFIYLGLTLFTETTLYFKPLFILIAVIGICAARWCAVFPLSKAVNALAAGLTGKNGSALQATVLVVVVLTVIIFGGTTARMLEIMGIRTGVVEEVDSDDEFDIETATNGTYYKSNAVGYTPKPKTSGDYRANGTDGAQHTYSSGTPSLSPPDRPTSRNNSTAGQRERDKEQSRQSLLARGDELPSDDEFSDSDLPPAARQPRRRSPPSQTPPAASSTDPGAGNIHPSGSEGHITATGAIQQLFSGTSEEQAAWFRQIDEGFIKPKLLLDQNRKGGP
ncbi:uncharacterized protein KY384_003838 [Bacidia gigantensis]|uniref:uncharacterized protein n=1 Tax=Bacidia gigantensis TaxID=2732470 RepID=UPI001D04E451|nr:uncharacterized protein KY384_003838 [Bacidia gigantensis]KAG8532197.1 hypothetical protein KY384_003838 [Bacidia gigantensis]